MLTATSGDSGDVEGEGLMATCRVDWILGWMGGDVVEGGERPGLDVGHGSSCLRTEEGEMRVQMMMMMLL